jgi:hypothetical protein
MERMIRLNAIRLSFVLVCTSGQAQKLTNAVIDKAGNVQVVASTTSSQHDFEFLVGDWQCHNRRLSKRLKHSEEWTKSMSSVTNRRFLNGVTNVDVSKTIRDGSPFETISIRTFNPQTRLWSSYWVDGKTGIMDPPVIGSFEQNIGTFYGTTQWEGKPVLVMYKWDKTNPQSPRWSQSYSIDNGNTWELNMENISTRPNHPPNIFAPGVISTDSSEFGSAFSQDGNMFYFARSVNKRSGIFFSRKLKTGWSTPERVSFSNSNYSDADPTFSPEGSLYFISTRPSTKTDTTSDYDIWKVSPTSTGWSVAENVADLNSPDNEFYISFTSRGDACFSSSRIGGYGEEDIYISEKKGDRFIKPINVGPSINSEHSEYDPFITQNALAIIFASSGRNDSFGKADLYWSARANEEWEKPHHFDDTINTAARDYCPYITSDQKLFFYSSQGDIKFALESSLPSGLLTILRK